MSETWIRHVTTSANLSKITPPGYNLHQERVPWWRTGFFVKDGLDSSAVPTKTCTTFENFLIKISLHKESFYFLNIYRAPSPSTSTFLEQFQTLLEDIHHNTKNMVFIGDFNFHQKLWRVLGDVLHRLPAKNPLGSWLTDLWSSSQFNFSYFPEVTTHISELALGWFKSYLSQEGHTRSR